MYSHLIADVFLFATAVVVPVTEPFMTHAIQRHSAQRFNAMFAPAVAQTVGDIAAHTTYDPGVTVVGSRTRDWTRGDAAVIPGGLRSSDFTMSGLTR
jgi:hypothetical protein